MVESVYVLVVAVFDVVLVLVAESERVDEVVELVAVVELVVVELVQASQSTGHNSRTMAPSSSVLVQNTTKP